MFDLPVPKMGSQVLSEGMNDILNRLLKQKQLQNDTAYRNEELGIAKEKLPLEKQLLQGQAAEHSASAFQKNMIANAISNLFSNNSNSDQAPNSAGMTNIGSPGNSNNTNVSNQSNDANKKNKLKQMLQALKVIQETPDEMQQREIETNQSKNMQEVDKKTLEEWSKTLNSNSEITPILEHNQELLADPKIQEALSHPEYLGYNIAYLKKFGKDPDLVQKLNQLGVNSKSLYSATLADFKGAVREYEVNLLKKFLPDEQNDSIHGIIAKNNAMLSIRDLITKRTRLANEIYRMGQGKISTNKAREQADELVKGKEVRKQIENNFKNEEKKQKRSMYEQQAKDAIAKGADPNAVNKHLMQLLGTS